MPFKLTAFLLFGISLHAFCQQNTLGLLVDRFQKERNFNGVVLASKDGKVGLLTAVGVKSRRYNLPHTTKTRFRIASITKTFTAVLVMQLVEEGQIDLGATIGTYLPEYTGEAKELTTIQQLLTYSSGIPNCEKTFGDTVYKIPVTTDQFISRYCSSPLDTVPGKSFNYDNGDYILLGRILEKVTGKSFEALLKRKILDPLKLENTGILHSDSTVVNLAETYLYNDSTKQFSPDPPYYIDNYFAAGAMYSTVEDLFIFDQAIFTNRLLKKKTLAKMLISYPQLGDVAIGFWESHGYGSIDKRFFYRPGGIYGATANWIHVIDPEMTIIVLSNTNATNLFELSQQLYTAISRK